MDVPFYDNSDPEPTSGGWLDVERIYCFGWDKFDHGLYDRLNEVFGMLAGAIGPDRHGCYWWYADHEDVEGGYLTAGVEPPGLQVFGTLRAVDWQVWDRDFRQRAVGLPVRLLRNG